MRTGGNGKNSEGSREETSDGEHSTDDDEEERTATNSMKKQTKVMMNRHAIVTYAVRFINYATIPSIF